MIALLAVLLAILLGSSEASAQSSPGFVNGQVITATQLNAAFAAKSNYPFFPGSFTAPGTAVIGAGSAGPAVWLSVGSGLMVSGNIISATGSPSGPCGGDLGGTFPSCTVLSVAHVTDGVLAPVNGGSGLASPTIHSLLVGEGTSPFNLLTPATAGRLVLDKGAGIDPAFVVMSGDATISGSGVLAVASNAISTTKIVDNAVTNAKAAQMPAHTFKGNNTGSTANQIDLTRLQLTADLNPCTAILQGMVPTPPNSAGVWLDGTCNFTTPPGAVSSVNGVTGAVGLPFIPQGRLTLQSGTPVMTADQTAKSTIYYDVFRGSIVPVWNGSNDVLLTIATGEISDVVPTSSTGVANASGVFDEWAVSVSGTLTLCHATNGSGGGWASDTAGSNTARGTGYSQVDKTTRPYVTNKNSIAHCYNGATDEGSISANQATYLGSFYTTGAGQTGMAFSPAAGSGGSNAFLGLFNAYNQVLLHSWSIDSTTNWTYATSTWRAANASNSNRISWVDGLAISSPTVEYGITTNPTALVTCAVGVDLDATSTVPTGRVGNITAGTSLNTEYGLGLSRSAFPPQLGLHFAQAVEIASGATCTFLGTNAGVNAMGLTFDISM